MKIALDQSVELEFNEWNLDQAAKHLSDVRSKAGDRADDIFRGMLTILLFGHIEQQSPGTIAKLSRTAENVAKTLDGPKVEKSA
jgi:hypothetical protein